MPFLLDLQTYGFSHLFRFLDRAFRHLTQPVRSALLLGPAVALALCNADLIAEKALLRHQLIILQRHVKKPRLGSRDRLWFLLLASRRPRRKEALLIFPPETRLAWHRQGFGLFGIFKSRHRGGRPRLSADPMAWIPQRVKEDVQFFNSESAALVPTACSCTVAERPIRSPPNALLRSERCAALPRLNFQTPFHFSPCSRYNSFIGSTSAIY